MEKFEISVTWNNENHHFEVRDYMHHDDKKCKYEIFKDGRFVVSFEPGAHNFLHICKNTGFVKDDLLNLLAEKLEAYHI